MLMGKAKGSRIERELFHMFYSTGKFMPSRIAGSGSVPTPAPDLIVGGMNRVLAIECKSGKGRRDIKKKQIEELKLFSKLFGAESWIGVRFDNTPWHFLELKHLGKSKGGNYFVSSKVIVRKGIKFEELIGKYKQKRLSNGQS